MAVDIQSAGSVAPVLINNAGAVGSQALGTSYVDQRYPLLSKQIGNNGSTFMYVYASSSLAQYTAAIVDYTGKAFALTAALSTIALGPKMVGFTDQGPIQATSYGWVTVSGLSAVKFKKGTLGNKPLWVSGTSGWLTVSKTVIASAMLGHSLSHVIGVVAVNPASGLGSVGCTATDSGDVRPIFIVVGQAYIDPNVASRNT